MFNILRLPPCCCAALYFLLTSVELVITEYDLLNSKYTYMFSLYYGYIRVSMASFIPLAITGFLVHKFTTAPCTSNRDGQEETNACGRRTSSSTRGRLDYYGEILTSLYKKTKSSHPEIRSVLFLLCGQGSGRSLSQWCIETAASTVTSDGQVVKINISHAKATKQAASVSLTEDA